MEDWKSNFLPISWEQFVNHAFNLSQKIAQKDIQPDIIVAIARGGLTLSQILSDYLKLPIASFTIKSYKDLKQESVPHITHELGSRLEGKKVLLVDDVSDTGKTFIRGISYLQELGAQKADITTASLHYKPHSKYKPDFFVSETPQWIIYPYEMRETIEALIPNWREKGADTAEIKKRFQILGFPPAAIETYVK